MKIKTQWKNGLALIFLGGLSAGLVDQAPAFMRTGLFFRLGGEGANVSEQAWDNFMDQYVTPRFEQHVQITDVTEHFLGEKGRERIPVRVLTCLHDSTAAADESIDYIRASYVRIFGKEQVVRVSVPVEASFRQEVKEPDWRELGTLQNSEIRESSGLAYATKGRPVLWTHNDSGDTSRFFAVGLAGEDLGTFTLEGARAVDWEDIASYVSDGRNWLLLADVGDNEERRPDCQLYIVEEPEAGESATVSVVRTISFVYEDGPRNCEAAAVDSKEQRILLIAKTREPLSGVYSLPLIPEDEKVTARRIADMRLTGVVAMDISPDGRDAVVLTYGDAFRWRRTEDESWASAFGREPEMLPMPYRKQGESVCYTPDGKRLLLTSEKKPRPLLEVTLP